MQRYASIRDRQCVYIIHRLIIHIYNKMYNKCHYVGLVKFEVFVRRNLCMFRRILCHVRAVLQCKERSASAERRERTADRMTQEEIETKLNRINGSMTQTQRNMEYGKISRNVNVWKAEKHNNNMAKDRSI